MKHMCVATVLTVYGIETVNIFTFSSSENTGLQQSLPFTVLKHAIIQIFF